MRGCIRPNLKLGKMIKLIKGRMIAKKRKNIFAFSESVFLSLIIFKTKGKIAPNKKINNELKIRIVFDHKPT